MDPCAAWDNLWEQQAFEPGAENAKGLRMMGYGTPSPSWSHDNDPVPGVPSFEHGELDGGLDFMDEAEGTPPAFGSPLLEFLGQPSPGVFGSFDDGLNIAISPLDMGGEPEPAFPGPKVSKYGAVEQQPQTGEMGEMDYEELQTNTWDTAQTEHEPPSTAFEAVAPLSPYDPYQEQLRYHPPQLREGEMDFSSTDNSVLGAIPVVGENDPGCPWGDPSYQRQLYSEGVVEAETKSMAKRGAPDLGPIVEHNVYMDEGLQESPAALQFPLPPAPQTPVPVVPLACDIPGWTDWVAEQQAKQQQEMLQARQAKHIEDRRVYRRKIQRYAEKRKHRNYKRRVTYTCRQRHATSRPRVNGRFIKETTKPSAKPLVTGVQSWGHSGSYMVPANHRAYGGTTFPNYKSTGHPQPVLFKSFKPTISQTTSAA